MTPFFVCHLLKVSLSFPQLIHIITPCYCIDATSQFPPAEVTQSKATSQNEEVSLSPQTTPW